MFKLVKGNTLVAGAAIYLASNILNAAIPFALMPILTRYLSPTEYGEVAMFQTLLGALAAIVGLSMHGAAGRKFYDGNLSEVELKEFVGSCLQVLLVTSTLTISIMFATIDVLSEWLELGSLWVLLAVPVTAASAIIQLRLGQWQVRNQAKNYGALQTFQSIVNTLLSLLLVVVFLLGAEGRIVGMVVAMTVAAFLSMWLLSRDGLLSFFVWRPHFIREIVQFGGPLVPHVGGIFLLTSVDRFVINGKLGLAETGVYMVAVQLAGALALIFDAINKAYVPWLYERLKRDDKREKRKIVRFTYAWFCLIACGAVLAFLIGPLVVSLVAGDDFSGAGDVIGWLALGQVFGGMYLMVTNYIFFSKRTGLLSFVTVFSGLINVLLLIILIEVFGILGAAYAFCIAMAIRFFLTWWVAQMRYPMPWFNLKT
ncbi:oligosaccharide flippase family protein [Marinobacter mobilis]|uniref:Membrane protein involved in the export of O-antigen and teichoic acid n=1 Tax=Marinobacter mobilis TaxID=488533 RepID=A0A1H2TK83_9GAMM|nr:oligosaccharide flippase family protein [Marinobacter mobilis]SDW44416.1 Membrane protein involved in the export of O-antigen and teichoic acid [Marinobacter mobilis]